MARKLTQGSVIPEFQYDTPYLPQQSFYQLLDDDKPVIMVFLRNFGHPLSRNYIMEYIKTADQLKDGRLVCVVQTRPQVIAEAIPENSMPYELICDAESVLYDFFGVESESNWLKSYSFKGMKILKEAKKQGFQEKRSEPQQLPLTAVVGRQGHVMFAHYGQSITDLPEDCIAMQRVMEGLLASIEQPEMPKEDSEEGWAWEEENREADTGTSDADEKNDAAPECVETQNDETDEVLLVPEEIKSEAENQAESQEESLADSKPENEFWEQPLDWEQPVQQEEKPQPAVGQLPGVAPRPKQKIDLAALGFLDEDDN